MNLPINNCLRRLMLVVLLLVPVLPAHAQTTSASAIKAIAFDAFPIFERLLMSIKNSCAQGLCPEL